MQQYIPWIISGLACLVAVLTFIRNGNKDERAEINAEAQQMSSIKESLLKVNMKLDQVCATTQETRTDIKASNKDIQNLETRIAVIERDVKIAFTRIEELNKGGN